MSLFVLSCKDGWVSIMYDGLDAVGVDQQVNTQTHRHTHTGPSGGCGVINEHQRGLRSTRPEYILFHRVFVLFCVSLRLHLISFVSSREGKYFRGEGRCKERKKADGDIDVS